ncbi:MAG: multiheme c-type cytochrome, partial [Roseibium sp.]
MTFIAKCTELLRTALAVLLVASPILAQEQAAPTYIGSEACADCHTDAAESWSGSDHALAWTPPTPANIVADFDETEFTHDGMLARFRVEDGRHFVTVTENDGITTDYPVHSVAGIRPLQQYILETEPGQLQSFDVVWDTERKTWFHLYPDQSLPPDDGLHWSGPYKNWNARCAECHATGFEKNYDAQGR